MPEPGSDRAWTWVYVFVALVLGWTLYLMFFGPSPAEPELPPPRLEIASPPRPADFSWKLKDLDGRPVELGKFRGKAIFLNLWATWCGPCMAEMPSIASLADDPRLKDVAFVCTSTDQSAEPVKRYLKNKNWNLTILRAEDMPETFATEGIPATFLIAPDGTIVVAEVGAAQWDDPKVVDFLERLAKGTPTPEIPRPAEPVNAQEPGTKRR